MTALIRPAALMVGLLTLAGCATQGGQSIYVPVTQQEPSPAPKRDEPSRQQPAPTAPQQTTVPEQDEAPGYRTRGETMAPAAKSLVERADGLLRDGQVAQAIAQLERAQRISPRSSVVYFKLAEAYVRKGDLARAEQFTLKGLSQAGDDVPVQRAGWQLLSDIRRARGDLEGAEQARMKSSRL